MNILLTTVVNAEENYSKDLFIHQIAKLNRFLMWTMLTWTNGFLSVKFQSEIEKHSQSNKSPCSEKDKRENNPYRQKNSTQIKVLVI